MGKLGVTTMYERLTTYVAGEWQDPETRCEVFNPADKSVVGSVGYGTAKDAVQAVDAAALAFSDWSRTAARFRADLLRDAAGLLTDRVDFISSLLAKESGKRLPEARGEVRFAAEYLRWFSDLARLNRGETIPNEEAERRHLTLRRPSGVALSLTPWNFPVSIQARKLAAALAAGCTVVARPSEKAPLAAVELVRCLADAGLPAGTVNLVHGPADQLVEAMLAHPAVRVVSFTGSTEVGRRVMALASRHVVRPLLELGGDAAFIVFDDADLDAAVEGALVAKFRNAGQSCIAANRFLVQEGVYEAFVARMVEHVNAMTVGDGTSDPVPDLSPLIDNERVGAVNGLVEEAQAAGAKQVTRGFDLPPVGSYAAPALLVNVPSHVGLAHQEIFGPVAGVWPFVSEVDAVVNANDTEMGLAAYAYTSSAERLFRLGENLAAGIIGFNCALPSVAFAPMGGVKQSGLGREGGREGLEEFSDLHYVAVGGAT